MKYTIITGSPSDGFALYGIFDDYESAVEWTSSPEGDASLSDSWHVITIQEVTV